MSKTDTSEKGPETLIMRCLPMAAITPRILFEWLMAFCYKSFMVRGFLFERKTSA